jgi:hypothetical protein
MLGTILEWIAVIALMFTWYQWIAVIALMWISMLFGFARGRQTAYGIIRYYRKKWLDADPNGQP